MRMRQTQPNVSAQDEGTSAVSVLVLTYKNREKLGRCVESVLRTEYPRFDVTVIDNAPEAGIGIEVSLRFPSVRVLPMPSNLGIVAYNEVISVVSSPFVAILNDDTEVDPMWLTYLMVEMRRDERIAEVVPKVLFMHDRGIINSAGGLYDILGNGCNRGNGEPDEGQYDRVEEVFYGPGGAALIRRSVWDQIGGYDDRYFLYAEDSDWCWRARLAGYRIVYTPNARVYHHWHTTTNDGLMGYLAQRHEMCNALKNYSLPTITILAPALAGELMLRFIALVWLRPKLAPTVFRALAWNVGNLPATFRWRRRVAELRARSDLAIWRRMYKGSIHVRLLMSKLRHPFMAGILKKQKGG